MQIDDPDLVEQGLEAWEVPEPPPDLTDRILAQNAQTLAALSRPDTTPEPADEETPIMLPTDPRPSSSNLRPFWTATMVGFAAAAALLLAFAAGQDSAPQAPTPSVPKVEVQVTAPITTPSTPPPPTPSRAPELPDKIIIQETTPAPVVKTPPPAPKAPTSPKSARTTRKKQPPAEERAILRLGTAPGVGLAQVYVDGKHVGSSPIARFDVDPGKHTVRYEWPDRSEEHEVDVKAGTATMVRGGKSTRGGKAKASGVSASGGGDEKALAATVKHRVSALQDCEPDASGKMSFVVAVDTKGRVTSVVIEEDTMGKAGVKTCVKAKIEGWRFPMKGADEGADVSFSVEFPGS